MSTENKMKYRFEYKQVGGGRESCIVQCAKALCKHKARTVVLGLISSRAKQVVQIRMRLLENNNQK